MTHVIRLVLVTALALLAGCVVALYHTAYPTTVSTLPSFDRFWHAALGATAYAGIQIGHADRGSGRITGSKGGAAMTIELRQQADNSLKSAQCLQRRGIRQGRLDGRLAFAS